MTPEQFAYWLQGFVELTQGQTPNPAPWKSIQAHLNTVFNKVTPPVKEFRELGTDRVFTIRNHLDLSAQSPTWVKTGDFPPGTITC
jgi:hypothetical protein